MSLLGRSGLVQRHIVPPFLSTPAALSVTQASTSSVSTQITHKELRTVSTSLPSILLPSPEFQVQVDWPNTDVWTAALDDVTADVRKSPGLTVVRGRDSARSISPPMAGTAAYELSSLDDKYAPGNAHGPLFGSIKTGKPTRVRFKYRGELWRGYWNKPKYVPDFNKRAMQVKALGIFSRLVNVKKSTTQLYEGIYTGQALNIIFDLAGFDAGRRRIDTGQTFLPFWWLAEEELWQSALALWASEGPGASLYETADGGVAFEDRHYRILATRSTTVQRTFTDAPGAVQMMSDPTSYDDGETNVVNECTVIVKSRSVKPSGVVWQYGSVSTSIGAGDSLPITVKTTDPFKNAIVPVAGTDFIIDTGSLASVTLSATSGGVTTMTFTAGGSGVTFHALQLRADTVSVDNSVTVTNLTDTSASKAEHGLQTFQYPTRPEIDPLVAQDFTEAVVQAYQYGLPNFSVTIKTQYDNLENNPKFDAIIESEISDLVALNDSKSFVEDNFFVNRIQTAIDPNGKVIIGTLQCEQVVGNTALYARWGSARWGISVWAF